MKRHTSDRNLSTEDMSVKRIVRHKEHHDSPSPEPILERESRKRSVTEREIHHSGTNYDKYTSGSKYSHNHSRRNSPSRSPSIERHTNRQHTHFENNSMRNKPRPHAQGHTGSATLLDQIDFSLHISNLDARPSEDEVRKALFKHFKRFGFITVKVLGYGKERRAFINYQHYDEARRAKKENQNLMLFTRPLHVEWSKSTLIKYPEVGSGKKPSSSSTSDATTSYFEDFHSGGPSHEHHSHSNIDHKRDVSYRTTSTTPRAGSTSVGGGGVESKPVVPVLDPNATRTLFVGNLELDVTERELRDLFSQYGRIESVDIKLAKSAGTSYSFVKFTTITDAINAKNDLHGRLYGTFRLKIGFGKGSPTGKVWVGNLNSARDLAEVRHEMDRFGLIRRCDYRDGDTHAYVHFESLEAAQAAVHALQNFRLRNGQSVKLDIHKPLHMREMEELTSGNESRRERRESNDYSSNHRSRARGVGGDSSFDSQKSSSDFQHGTTNRDRVVNEISQFDRNYRKRSRNSDSYRQVSHTDDELTSHSKRRASDYESSHRNSKSYHSRDNGGRRDSRREEREGSSSSHTKQHSSDKHSDTKNDNSAKTGGGGSDNDKKSNGEHKSVSDTSLHSFTTEAAATNPSMLMEGDTALKLSDSTEPISPDSDSKGPKSDSTHSESLSELGKSYPIAWRGNLVLKNTGFPARLHLAGGDPSVAEYLLRGKDEPNVLRITQRLRLEQPRLDEVNKRLTIAGPSGHCILFALPCPTVNHNSPDESDSGMQLRPLRSLVSYLKQKEAAGIVALNASDIGDSSDGKDPREVIGVLHAFPPCEFSQAQLLKVIPSLGFEPSKEDHIVVLLVKGNV